MIHLKTVQPDQRQLLWNINQKYLYEMTNYYDDPMDEEFLSALDYGMPNASGNALGVDRLIMLIAGVDKLVDTVWVPCKK